MSRVKELMKKAYTSTVVKPRMKAREKKSCSIEEAIFRYDKWIARNEADIMKISPLTYEPMISVIMPVYNVERVFLKACIDSVVNQTYQNWELCLSDDCSTMPEVRETLEEYRDNPKIKIVYREENGHISRNTNSGLAVATGEFIALLDCDDVLSPNALYEMAKKLNENNEYDFIYSDEDKLSEDGRIRENPFFKPDWSPDTFMSLMYTCHLAVFRKSLMDELGGLRVGVEGSQDYDLVMRVMEKTDRIGHVAKILYHWRQRKESTAAGIDAKPYALLAAERAKKDALERRHLEGHIEYVDPTMQYRIVYHPQEQALVSIIIHTSGDSEALHRCLDSIKENTKNVTYECIVVESGRHPAQMYNEGAKKAKGKYLLFLDDAIEVKGEEWLWRMLGHAELSHVGAVSAMLLYPGEQQIAQCGYINTQNLGPVPAFGDQTSQIIWYNCRNVLDYNNIAVTSSCLLVSTEKYHEIGGFCEDYEAVYQDLDFCYSLLEKKYYNVVRTDVILIHHGGSMRTDAMQHKTERDLLLRRHPKYREYDPCYNPNLTQNKVTFDINMDSNVEKSMIQEISMDGITSNIAGFVSSIDSVYMFHRIMIQGWAFRNKHEKQNKTQIILEGHRGKAYQLPADDMQRNDVESVYQLRKSAVNCGFCIAFDRDWIPKDTYNIWIMIDGVYVKTGALLEMEE